jgi:hypothetical protein
MKKLLLIPALFILSMTKGQNVKLEIFDLYKKMDERVYSIYQFAQASYSHSRATLVFITSKKTLLDLSQNIPRYFQMKQEYTDVWILGIDQVDLGTISITDNKIIEHFLNKIIKYRSDNDLPVYTFERLNQGKVFLENDKEFCRYVRCK